MDRIQLRRDSSDNWAKVNPILLEGEVGFETDTKLRKIGDGVHRWNDLEYLKAEGISQETGNNQNITMSQDTITRELSELGSKMELKTAEILGDNIVRTEEIEFTSNYSQKKLGFIIPKGAVINLLSDDISTISGRTTSEDTEYQMLHNGTIADRNIQYIKNIDIKGKVQIGYEAEGIYSVSQKMSDAEKRDNKLFDSITGKTLGITKVVNPARKEKKEEVSGIFRGYEVDLTNLFSEGYEGVYFWGTEYSETSDIVKGYIEDNEGEIESITEWVKKGDVQLCYLPITDKSVKLKATYAFVSNATHGVVKWTPSLAFVKTANTNTIIDAVMIDKFKLENNIEGLKIIEKTLEPLNLDVKNIVEKVGKSTAVYDLVKVSTPARKDGANTSSGFFKGYEVDLTNYRDNYASIYFRGANYNIGGTIIQGYIVDDEGNIESNTENKENNFNSWVELPLTNKSKTLKASYCISASGGEVWTPEYVEFRTESKFYKKEEVYNKDEINEMVSEVGNKSIEIFLPSDIYAIKGKVSQLFYRGFVKAVNPYKYDIKVMCAVGKTFPRYYEIGSTAAVGDYPIKVEVRDDNRNVLAVKESTLHIIAETPKSSLVNVLCVGASATATGHWPAELKRLLANNFNANFVGRKTGYSDTSVNLEAIGGWTWGTFIKSGSKAIRFYISSSVGDIGYGDKLTYNGNTYTVLEVNLTDGIGNIRCTGASEGTAPVNPTTDNGILSSSKGTTLDFNSWEEERYAPFYNEDTDKIDFKTYADKYCDGNIDIIVVHLGVNSVLWEDSNINNAITSAKQFIDGYLADFPNGKMIISAIPMPDEGTNVYANTYGDNNVNRYGTLSTFMLYNNALRELTESYSNVYWASSDIFFDTDYGYPKTEKNVNSRISAYKELIGTNGVHPIKEGSYMVADGILPIFVKMINE